MTAVSYPNSRPPSVATNVNPTISEVFTFVIRSPSFTGENFLRTFSRNPGPQQAHAAGEKRGFRRRPHPSASAPPRVHEILVRGAGTRVVRGQEQRQRGNVLGLDAKFQALLCQYACLLIRSVPEPGLARRTYSAGYDTGDADTVIPQLTRQCTGHTLDSRLGCLVRCQIRQCQMPRDRAEFDDGTAACSLHSGRDRLGTKKQMSQVHGQAIVPILRGDTLEGVPVVVACVVDQDLRCPGALGDLRKGGVHGLEVAQIAVIETRRGRGGLRQRALERARLLHRDVQKTDGRALARVGGNDRGADPGSSSGDNHSFAPQARVDCGVRLQRGIVHSTLFLVDSPEPSRPRAARFRMSADNPKVHGGAASHVVTLFSRIPSRSLNTRTTSPCLCVKPRPGTSRSSMGANIVPRNSAKPSGYWWCRPMVWPMSSSGSRLMSRMELAPLSTEP